MNHREAWALEHKAPRNAEAAQIEAAQETKGDEVIVVVTKVKAYIRERWGLNTSGAVMEILSDFVRKNCDQAIETAKQSGRQTVMDRDLPND